MRHQYLSFPQNPCLSSDGKSIEFFMVLVGFTEESLGLSVHQISVNFSSISRPRHQVCHLPEQNICATRIKPVMWRAWLAQCVQLPPFWDTDNPCSASIPMCVVTYLWHTKLEGRADITFQYGIAAYGCNSISSGSKSIF